MARKIVGYLRSPDQARGAGHAGRSRAERVFSLHTMMAGYRDVYDRQLEFALPSLRRIGTA
jgi:hypothetical protein